MLANINTKIQNFGTSKNHTQYMFENKAVSNRSCATECQYCRIKKQKYNTALNKIMVLYVYILQLHSNSNTIQTRRGSHA